LQVATQELSLVSDMLSRQKNQTENSAKASQGRPSQLCQILWVGIRAGMTVYNPLAYPFLTPVHM